MNHWVDLFCKHDSLRNDPEAAEKGIRQVLGTLGTRQPAALSRYAHSQLVPRTDHYAHRKCLSFDEPLKISALNETFGANGLVQARLTVNVLIDEATEKLNGFTLAVEGSRQDGSPWTVAVHFDHKGLASAPDLTEGDGACSHAALHCHVGPGLDAKPKVRVPLPPLPPSALLEWLMTQVVPHVLYEPAPWPAVAAALAPKPGV